MRSHHINPGTIAAASVWWGGRIVPGERVEQPAEVKTSTTARLIDILFPEYHFLFVFPEPIGVHGEVATMDADRVNFGDIFRYGEQLGHRAKGSAPEIHIQPGHNYPYAAQGKLLTIIGQLLIKKLRLVNPHHAHAFGKGNKLPRMRNWGRVHRVGIVGDNLPLRIAQVYLRLENFHPLVGNFSPFQPPDEFFSFSGEHGAANDFDPSMALSPRLWFYKHVKNLENFGNCFLLILPSIALIF
ncbi:MAG: hypothetical protein RL386_1186 [Bacteroidota bacterium]|jgi:hypothetical protein